MVYCKQDKGTSIEKILERNCSIKEKKLRLLALDQERKHEALCDLTLEKPEDVQKIFQFLYLNEEDAVVWSTRLFLFAQIKMKIYTRIYGKIYGYFFNSVIGFTELILGKDLGKKIIPKK